MAIIVVMGAIGGLLVKVSTPSARAGPYTILVSLDGFRWDYFEKFKENAPQLLQLREEGVYAECKFPMCWPENLGFAPLFPALTPQI